MRYIHNQLHKKTCGPTAIANCLKDIGFNSSYKQLVNMYPETIRRGMHIEEIVDFLNYNKIKFKIIKPTFKSMEKEIDKGHGMILLYKWCGKKKSHCIYVNKYTDKYFIGYNYNSTKFIKKKEIANDLRWSYRTNSDFPVALVIIGDRR